MTQSQRNAPHIRKTRLTEHNRIWKFQFPPPAWDTSQDFPASAQIALIKNALHYTQKNIAVHFCLCSRVLWANFSRDGLLAHHQDTGREHKTTAGRVCLQLQTKPEKVKRHAPHLDLAHGLFISPVSRTHQTNKQTRSFGKRLRSGRPADRDRVQARVSLAARERFSAGRLVEKSIAWDADCSTGEIEFVLFLRDKCGFQAR